MGKLSVEDLKRIHSTDIADDREEPDTVPELGAPEQKVEPSFRRNKVRPATEKQIDFLKTLVEERAPDTDPEFVEDVISQGMARVSKAIDNLLAKPKAQNVVKTSEQTTRLNRYKGSCEECGGTVFPEEGRLTKTDHGEWEVIHIECPPSEFPFPFGRYAVETEEGHLAFYILTERGLFVQAGDEKHPIPYKALASIVKKIAADPEAASIRYGLELQQCGRCGKTLTDEDSRARGIGPVCATKGWT